MVANQGSIENSRYTQPEQENRSPQEKKGKGWKKAVAPFLAALGITTGALAVDRIANEGRVEDTMGEPTPAQIVPEAVPEAPTELSPAVDMGSPVAPRVSESPVAAITPEPKPLPAAPTPEVMDKQELEEALAATQPPGVLHPEDEVSG